MNRPGRSPAFAPRYDRNTLAGHEFKPAKWKAGFAFEQTQIEQQQKENTMYNRETGFLVALAVLVLTACGEDPKPPVACAVIPQQELHVGEEATITACFTDPQAGTISYTATSLHPDVAEVSTSNEMVTITALKPGNTTVRITATNLESLSAIIEVPVLVPNRAPTAVGNFGHQRLGVNEKLRFALSEYFEDPDMEMLDYDASSSDDAIVVIEVLSDTLTLVGGQEGQATVSVSATDAGGETAELSAVVTVFDGTLLLSDNFDEDTGAWEHLAGSGYQIADGFLTLWPSRSEMGVVSQVMDAERWRVESTTRIEEDEDQGYPGLVILNDHPTRQAYFMQVSRDRPVIGEPQDTINVSFYVFYAGLGWVTFRNWRTRSDLVKTGVDLNITFEVKNRDIICRVEGKVVIRISNPDFFTPRMTHLWLVGDGDSTTESMFSSVRLYGTARDPGADVIAPRTGAFSPLLLRMPR